MKMMKVFGLETHIVGVDIEPHQLVRDLRAEYLSRIHMTGNRIDIMGMWVDNYDLRIAPASKVQQRIMDGLDELERELTK